MKRDSQLNSIYGYLDALHFLRDRIELLKKSKWFSARKFAQKAGFKSPSFLKMLLDGSRSMTPAAIAGLAQGLGLSKDESKFFETLVEFNQAKSPDAQNEAYRKILSFKKYQSIKKIEAHQYVYLSHWYHVAIREGLSSASQNWTFSQWASALEISERQVAEAFERLLELGLIQKSSEGGYLPVDAALQTPREMASLVVRNFHREMIQKALIALDEIPTQDRDLGSLTISLSPKNFEAFRQRVAHFRREMNALFSEDREAEQVYQLNFQIFPLLKVKPGEKSA